MRNKYSRVLLLIIVMFVVIFLSIGYSAFDESLLIDSVDLTVRVKEDIRVTGISVSNVNDATSHYEDYNVKNITSGITLPNSNSSITYEVEVTNYGNVEMGILSIDNLPDYLEYELIDYKLSDKLCDNDGTCKLGSKTKFYLTIKYKDNKYDSKNVDFDFSLEFVFKRFYSVTYENFSSYDSFEKEVIEGGILKIDFSSVMPLDVLVSMNGIDLVSGANYEYSNYILTLKDVFGDVNIVYIDGRTLIDNGNNFVTLNNISHIDDNYLFAGDVYYLNPYDLSIKCDSSNYIDDASSNPNQCMKWYQISEDDEYVTLILNSNLGDPVDDAEDITSEANLYMKTFTDSWDDKLLLFDNLVIDGYDYSGYKARLIAMDEIASVVEKAYWTSSDYAIDIEYVEKYYSFLLENLDSETWRQAGYFTSTNHSSGKNYAFNVGGLDVSVSDSYTHGVRPVIVVKKDDLDLGREKIFSNDDVTYLSYSFVSDEAVASEKNLEFHIKNMRASGIKKAYLNVGYMRLNAVDDGVEFVDKLTSFVSTYESNIARIIRIGRKYGVEVVPWLNYQSIELDLINLNYSDSQVWGEYVIEQFGLVIDDMLTNGFYCEDDGKTYYLSEIHLDAEPMRKKYQDYYLTIIQKLDFVIGERANFTVAAPAIDVFSTSYIETLAQYVNGFNIMIYDSSGPSSWGDVTQSKADYIAYVQKTILNYSNALTYYNTEFYALGGMYEDTYSTTEGEGWPDSSSGKIYAHLNFYNGEEMETIGNLVEATLGLDNYRLNGIGFYNWDNYSSYYSTYNKGSYITDEYNYITVRKDYLREWAYK